jgi:hypothetical protein
MGFLDIVGLKYNLGIAYVNIFNDGRFNSSMWVLPKFVLIYGFIMTCMYCILGFCSMMNVYLGARICPTSFNHEKGSKVPIHSCPEPHQVPFAQQTLILNLLLQIKQPKKLFGLDHCCLVLKLA